MKKIKVWYGKYKFVGFKTLFLNYGKNPKQDYRLEIIIWEGYIPLYKSAKKPMFRNLYIIGTLVFWIPIVLFIPSIIFILLLKYISGMISFIKDSRDITYQRFFNYCNIILIFALLTKIIIF